MVVLHVLESTEVLVVQFMIVEKTMVVEGDDTRYLHVAAKTTVKRFTFNCNTNIFQICHNGHKWFI